MSYTYSFERVTPETEGYGDTIFDTPENNTEPADLFSDLSEIISAISIGSFISIKDEICQSLFFEFENSSKDLVRVCHSSLEKSNSLRMADLSLPFSSCSI